jgi:hypothetical protein
LLSASGSKKWLTCPPSVRLEEHYPEKPSSYAEEGSLAHEIGELKLRKTFEVMTQRTFTARMKKLKEHPLYQAEMLNHTDTYVNKVCSILSAKRGEFYSVEIERKVDYSHIAPEGFGTCDCVLTVGNTLYIIDFKYGKGVPVSAVQNTQLMLYALGAYSYFSMLFQIEQVTLVIVQPRLDEEISEWSLSLADLLAWGESIKPIAQLAYNGGGEFKAGDHCRFCKVKSTCRTRANHYLELEGFNSALPPVLDNATVGDILERAEGLVTWLADLKEYALAEALQGREISGWKLVEGRSNRRITDVDTLFSILVGKGYSETMLYKKEPITLTALEGLLGKQKFQELCNSFVVKPQGAPTLVRFNDKREAFVTRTTAEEDFRE